jgi:hypothetical protein
MFFSQPVSDCNSRLFQVHLKSTPNKTKKTSHLCEVFSLVAPPIGESCSFESMVKYSIILKSYR